MITVSLPKVLKDSIEKNGISWPSITGLKEAQTEADKNERVDGNIWIKAGSSNWMAILLLEFRAKFNQDPEGNLLAVVLLISMTFSVFGVVLVFSRTPSTKLIIPPMWIISLLSVIGLAIAAYFIYIGITGTEIVCGPVGDCHTVQQSSFAYLFGIIPVSIPGFLSYLIILMSCFIKRSVSGDLRDYLAILIWGIS
ncbi:hypothetical protein KKA14_13315, partial [bacterium]|nr:hypothetical protein [bacterium]